MRGQNSGPLLSTVFLDYDNLYQSLKRKSDEAAKRFAKDVSFWLSLIESGQLITATNQTRHPQNRHLILNRCYGNPVPRRNSSDNSTDMNSFPFVRHHFLRAGLEIVDCPPLTSQLKNSAEIRIVMDVNDLMNHQTRFDEFIILSGDADFTPLLYRLRAHARRTVVYVNDLTAAPYAAIADGEIRESSLLDSLLHGREEHMEEVVTAEVTETEPPSIAYSGPQMEAIRSEIISNVVVWVQTAGHPLALDSLADRVTRTLGHERTLGTGWAGMGTFGALLHKGLPPTLRVSGQAPYFVYDICLPVGGEASSNSQEGSRSQNSEIQGDLIVETSATGSLKSSPRPVTEKTGAASLESSTPSTVSDTSTVSSTPNTSLPPASSSGSSVNPSSAAPSQGGSSTNSSQTEQTTEASSGSLSSVETSSSGFSHVTLFQPQLPFAPQPQPSTYPAQLSQLAYAAQFFAAPISSAPQTPSFSAPPLSAPYSPQPIHVSYGAPTSVPNYPAQPQHPSLASQTYSPPHSPPYSGPYSTPPAPSYIPHQTPSAPPSFAPRGVSSAPYSGPRPQSAPTASSSPPYAAYSSPAPVGAYPVHAPYSPHVPQGSFFSTQRPQPPYAPLASQAGHPKSASRSGYGSSSGHPPQSPSSAFRAENPSSHYGSKQPLASSSPAFNTQPFGASSPATVPPSRPPSLPVNQSVSQASFAPPTTQPPVPKKEAPSPETAAAIQKSITRIQNACEVPALSPPEYKILFDVMAQEITANGLSGAQTLANISQRAAEQSVKVRRDDIRFVLEVVSEADPWFEQGASADIFSSRFRNFVITRCRNKDLQLTSAEINLIDTWFGGGTDSNSSLISTPIEPPLSPSPSFDSPFETSSSSFSRSPSSAGEEKSPSLKRGRKRA